MKIRQAKNSFIRIYDGGTLGYIYNQLTKYDRTYDESGADFLSQLSRQPKDIDSIVDNLVEMYDGADRNTIYNDFMDFANDLAEHKFVVMGETLEEMDSKDMNFSYSMENPKILDGDLKQEPEQTTNDLTQEFLQKHDREKPRLVTLEFEITSRCNERCIHCYIPNGRKNAGIDLSLERFKYILDQFVEMGGLHVIISGGEVLMNKDLTTILRYCREKDVEISLLTNLIALKDEHIPVLKEVNLSQIQVSLYSMDSEKHDMITTVKGSFEKTKAAIEKLYAADIPVQINCPIMKANKKGYDEVMRYAQSMRMKVPNDYTIMAQADLDTANLANRISIKETEELLRDSMEYDDDLKEILEEESPDAEITEEELRNMPLCEAGINDLCVTVTGDVYPCSGWQGFVVGNVFKQPLKDIWENSPKLKEIRGITQGDFEKCLKCAARNYCKNCLVCNYNESGGDMYKVSKHFCEVAFLRKRLADEWREKKRQK